MPDIEEEDLKRLNTLIEVLKLSKEDSVNPDEVVAAIEIILELISEVQRHADSANVETKRAASRENEETLRKYRSTKKKVNVALARMDGMLEALTKWKEARDNDTLEDEIDILRQALDDCADDVAEVRAFMRVVKKKKGPPGKPGRMPDHEWDETRLRFERPDGTWGEWVELKGDPGHSSGFFGFGGGPHGLTINRLTTNGSSGPATLSPDGTLNIPQYSGGGSAQTIEEPVGTIDDSNVAFVFNEEPFLIVMNERTYRKGGPAGWSWDAGTFTATMPSAVGTGGDIYGIMQ